METTARFNRLDDAGWHRVLARFTIAILGNLPGEHPANVAAMWRRVVAGDEPTEQEWREAEWAAAWAAAAAQERAARASARAASARAARATSRRNKSGRRRRRRASITVLPTLPPTSATS